MKTTKRLLLCGVTFLAVASAISSAAEPLCISGRYPHLTMFNKNRECGLGAVVPWADRLWVVTYAPHHPGGGDDKLYEIDPNLNMVIRPESIGGTPANRLIHRESNQLIIGPYFIDAERNVRVLPYEQAYGRPTATVRHLTDPANKVYWYTMEEGVYEVDVHTLEVKVINMDRHKGGADIIPGYHGKGGYSGQGRLVVSNNGRPKGPHRPFDDNSGCLAEWDGEEWHVIVEHQFNEVTGPGGIYGNDNVSDPVWATGWDKKSLLLMVLDDDQWHRFRVPIADFSYMASHGWFTEWPRIRELVPASGSEPPKLLMNMHGGWFDLPKTFSASTPAGLRPIGQHVKITGDFCHWRDEIVFACDDTSLFMNPFVNQGQSNLWFTTWKNLHQCGRPAGWGGVWLDEQVTANTPSDPYLFAGYSDRVVHLANDGEEDVTFTVEIDVAGDGEYKVHETILVPSDGYAYHVFPESTPGQWVRVRTDRDCAQATAYFHFGPGGGVTEESQLFAALADADSPAPHTSGIMRPRGGDLGTLQLLAHKVDQAGNATEAGYYEAGSDMKLEPVTDAAGSVEYLKKSAPLGEPQLKVDAASAMIVSGGATWRLPKADAAYDEPFAIGWPRDVREVVTERRLLNAHGTIYVLPHAAAGGLSSIKPVCTHDKRIVDFCSWRGMLVIAGTRADAVEDGHYFESTEGKIGLWFGDVDDLWKLGKPRGKGGPWLETDVTEDEPSEPYLMTGYDQKTLTLSHDANETVKFTIEVDFVRNGKWCTYDVIEVPAGQTVTHEFPDGYSAHWVRLTADRDCKALGQFSYD